MSLTAEQRRALIMLAAAGQNGVSRRLLSAHGLNAAMIRWLVNQGSQLRRGRTLAQATSWSRPQKFGLRTQAAPHSRPKGKVGVAGPQRRGHARRNGAHDARVSSNIGTLRLVPDVVPCHRRQARGLAGICDAPRAADHAVVGAPEPRHWNLCARRIRVEGHFFNDLLMQLI